MRQLVGGAGGADMHAATVARIIGVMVRTHTGLDDSATLQTMNATGTSLWEKDKQSEPKTWNVEVFIKVCFRFSSKPFLLLYHFFKTVLSARLEKLKIPYLRCGRCITLFCFIIHICCFYTIQYFPNGLLLKMYYLYALGSRYRY